ncbi:hypothetical protein LWI29_025989 [Acer saccharum]|uniref:Protein kinase domain-containing protein n=1 Tax=Acer saccharum TaxID=4024 RepID=A0AA39S6R3_ACESA|nr:hypothetical protein LWI29_025989 [Acer saccharum]
MGCACSKKPKSVAAASPENENEGDLQYVYSSKSPSGAVEIEGGKSEDRRRDLGKSKKGGSLRKNTTFTIKLGLSHRHVDAEHIAAGWPAWLTAAAADAVHGMVPLRAESFEKLDKIGQGTYSSVFRAREVATGRMVALKKVRFDNFQPESIRFMAREIMILRRLDHPNIMKLEGVITSRLSSTIYLVFEYMEHDLAGLSSSTEIFFNEAQVKCYMKQLLLAVEHCHLRGIMHRDIKSSNILVNNQGVLKLGDFGLANILTSKNRQKLTSRVVTLWYRPPELLMGSTSYNVSVDLWSVGCVFSELLFGKPILKGRTEVEQLHKIFKLCGSPSEEFWKKSKLPQGDMFKPQNNYEGYLQERCKDLPTTTVNLIQSFLSIDPYKRGTASSALMSEYFHTQPYACDPSNLPKYPPKKEIDAKQQDDAQRKKARARIQESGIPKKLRRSRPTLEPYNEMQDNGNLAGRNNGTQMFRGRGGGMSRDPMKPSFDSISETSQLTSTSQVTSASRGYSVLTVPGQVSASSGFTWAKRQNDDAATTLSSRSQVSGMDSSNLGFATDTFNLPKDDRGIRSNSKEKEMYETSTHPMPKQLERAETFDTSNLYYSQDPSTATSDKERGDHSNNQDNKDQSKVKHSGPLLSETQKIEELLQRNENNIRRAVRRSRFYRER